MFPITFRCKVTVRECLHSDISGFSSIIFTLSPSSSLETKQNKPQQLNGPIVVTTVSHFRFP